MAKKTNLEQTLYDAMIQELIDRIQSGEATPADLKVVNDFMKNNNISSNMEDSEKLRELKSAEIELDEEYANGFQIAN